jgi:hypothetical protein
MENNIIYLQNNCVIIVVSWINDGIGKMFHLISYCNKVSIKK